MKTLDIAPTTLVRPSSSAADLAHADVVRAIRSTLLRQGVRREDLPDAVAEVQLRSLEATLDQPPPSDVGGWKALACTIAKRMAIKERQRRKRRSLHHAGLCDDPDQYGPVERAPSADYEPLDVHRELSAVEATEQGAAIVVAVAEGLSASEIAAELALTDVQVRRRLVTIRKKMRNRRAACDQIGRERN